MVKLVGYLAGAAGNPSSSPGQGDYGDLDDHLNGGPVALDPIPCGTLKNLGDVDN